MSASQTVIGKGLIFIYYPEYHDFLKKIITYIFKMKTCK